MSERPQEEEQRRLSTGTDPIMEVLLESEEQMARSKSKDKDKGKR